MQARTVHAPQVGFNNNVRHKGKVYHIQTEDSGVNYARITTHLFADGGRILRSERTDYQALLGSKDLATELRRRMKEQHRAMFVALREGHLDHLIEQGASASQPSAAQPSASQPSAAQPSASQPAVSPALASPALASRPAARPSASQPSASPSSHDASSRRSSVASKPAEPPLTSAPPAAKPTGSARPRLAKVEIGPVASDGSTLSGDADRASGTRISDRCREEPSLATHVSGGHAAVRPSLEGVEPAHSGGSIFGTASISEQSLDDVILSYISDDLDSE